MPMLWVNLLAGLLVFLAGVRLLALSLQNLAGQRLLQALPRWAGSPARALVLGAIVAAALHSSGVTAASSIALVHAGLLTETQGFAVILGANVGTTITAQLATFRTEGWAEPLLAIGLLLVGLGVWTHYPRSSRRSSQSRPFTPVQRWAWPGWLLPLGAAICGLGALFLGIELMATAAQRWAEHPSVVNWLVARSRSTGGAALAGALIAGLLQSSTVTVGMALVGHSQGLFPLPIAVAIVLGANVGTSIQSLLASIGTDRAARRTAMADLLFNGLGVALVLPLLPVFTHSLEYLSAVPARRVANAHTLFNVFTAVAALPWIPLILRWADRTVRWLNWIRPTVVGPTPAGSRPIHCIH